MRQFIADKNLLKIKILIIFLEILFFQNLPNSFKSKFYIRDIKICTILKSTSKYQKFKTQKRFNFTFKVNSVQEA